MTAALRARHEGAGSFPAANARMAEQLELPRPLRLLGTSAWSVTESAGLPVAAYAIAAWLGGRDAGLLAGLAAIWVTAAIRKVATGCVPSLLTISAVVLTLQTAVVIGTGELWIFLLQFPLANLCMCVLFARTARGPSPLVARLAAEVVALRQPAIPPGPAPLLPGGDLAVGGHLLAAHGQPGGVDGDRADRHVPDVLDHRHRRARRRRKWRVHAVVPVCAPQPRAQAPFRPRPSPAAPTGSRERTPGRRCRSAPTTCRSRRFSPAAGPLSRTCVI